MNDEDVTGQEGVGGKGGGQRLVLVGNLVLVTVREIGLAANWRNVVVGGNGDWCQGKVDIWQRLSDRHDIWTFLSPI